MYFSQGDSPESDGEGVAMSSSTTASSPARA